MGQRRSSAGDEGNSIFPTLTGDNRTEEYETTVEPYSFEIVDLVGIFFEDLW